MVSETEAACKGRSWNPRRARFRAGAESAWALQATNKAEGVTVTEELGLLEVMAL